MSDESSAAPIRALNDHVRLTMSGARIMLTAGVSSLGPERIARIIEAVRTFSAFSDANDPYGEHDFGAFDESGDRLFFKFDYYDRSMTYGSEDAADASKTVRVLTIMLAEEY
jgi:hypothetical protein